MFFNTLLIYRHKFDIIVFIFLDICTKSDFLFIKVYKNIIFINKSKKKKKINILILKTKTVHK